MKSLAIVVALTLTACMSIAAVRLEHPKTGHIVTCGPYTQVGQIEFAANIASQRGCIRDFKEQGYVRVP